MAPRIRSIKPELPADEKLARCSIAARYLFVLLITQADDAGRMRGATSFVRAHCMPYDDLSLDFIEGCLEELSAGGFLTRYTVEDERYLQLDAWSKNQRIDKPRASRIPAPSRRFVEPSKTPLRSVADESQTEGEREGERDVEGDHSSSAVAADVESIAECEHLADWIERNGSKRPAVTKAWLQAADRLKRLDGRTHEQVMTCIDWCQRDEFWRSNVLSMPKLREKYDQLRLVASRRAAQPSGSDIRAAIARGEA